MTRKLSFVLQSQSPQLFKKSVFVVGVAKPEAPRQAAKKTTRKAAKKSGRKSAKKAADRTTATTDAQSEGQVDWKTWENTFKGWTSQQGLAVLEMADPHVRRAVEAGTFDASRGSTLLLPAGEDNWLLLVGLGKEDKLAPESLVHAGAVAMRKAADVKDHRIVSLLHAAPVQGLETSEVLEATVQGFVLGSYKFDRFLSKDDGNDGEKGEKKRADKGSSDPLLEVSLLVEDARASRNLKPNLDSACNSANAQLAARDLANTPPNVATPEYLAKEARKVARESGLTCKVLGLSELKQKKMTGLLAVGGGSSNPPRLIVMRHTPKRNRARTFRRVVVVGKGITFDTGGISLKPGDRMELMKFDKSGACAVIALMGAVARANLPVEVIGLAACAENMPSGTAYRPGDILTMGPGKSVEVLNTDAEGRMVLADALHYAGEFDPDAVVDLATLTGAIDVALGSHYSGLMGTDDELLGELEKAGKATGEKVWRMPIGDEYQKQIKGTHSDLVNIGGRSGGALTAGQFLSNFKPDAVAWAHLDIAGTAWDDKPSAENPKGATGVGVRLMYRFLQGLV